MKLIAPGLLALSVAALLPLCASSQQHYSYTGVTRVVTIRILPGKSVDFFKAFAYAPKVFEAEKEAGLITSYALLTSIDYSGPDKWDYKIIIRYKDMAALDDLSNKADPVIAKVYGTPENRAEISRLRTESSEVVSSELERDIVLKP
jgi:hypothetical protein